MKRSTLRSRDIDTLLSGMNDYRAGVAAGKVQRWDVAKWAVAFNLGFATAAVALEPKLAFMILTLMGAGIGTALEAV